MVPWTKILRHCKGHALWAFDASQNLVSFWDAWYIPTYIYIYKNIYGYARISYIHRYNLPTTKRINYRFTSPSIRRFLCVKHPTHAESRQSYRSANDTSASHGSLPRRWKKFNGEKVRGCEYVENMVTTLPETNEYPLKSDGWKMTFPFGARDYFQGRTAVL